MKVSCPSCSSVLNIDDKKIPPGGARIKCPTCQNIFPVKPGAASSPSGVVALPPKAAPQAPTQTQPAMKQDWEEEATRVSTGPLPAAAIPGATTREAPPTNVRLPGKAVAPPTMPTVPLPAVSAPPDGRGDWQSEPTYAGEVPLPIGVRPTVEVPIPTGAVPLPGSSAFPGSSGSGGFSAPAPTLEIPAATALRASPSGVALPGAAASSPSGVALPGSARSSPSDVALPGGAGMPRSSGSGISRDSGAVSLPGAAAEARAPRGPGVPLPGAATEAATALAPVYVAPGNAVPLPGQYGTQPSTPAFDPPEVGIPQNDEVELPGPDTTGFDDAGPAPAFDPAMGGGFDFSEAPPEPASAEQAPSGFDFLAPPDPRPASSGSSAGAFSFDAPAPEPESSAFNFQAPPPAAAPADTGAFSFDAPPPPPEPTGLSFDAVAPPEPAAPSFSFDAPPEPAADANAFSFDAPAPPPPASNAFSFDAPAPAPEGFSFDAPPPPAPAAAPAAFDFSAPPASTAATTTGPALGFGEVDFSGGGGGGDLEFDPTGGGAPRAADDLEADLSAPLPRAAPSGPADGLEMLSFIDKGAQEAGAPADAGVSVRRFHVKRRSGKIFGPFEEAVIVKMLEDGQLLGNEEVSLDAENWIAIGGEPAFQAVISKLMEAPARAQTQAQVPQVEEKRGPSMDRLKQLYEGRMAAVAVVQSKDPVPFKKRLPLIFAAAAVLGVLGTGIFLGTATPYGFFALKLLFPAKVKPDTREFGYLQAARKAFQQDTWKSYKAAKDSANQALQIKDYPEARAVWCQAVFYLDRRFGKADAAELAKAHEELVNVRLLGEKHPEVLKTEASAALTKKEADQALSKIADAVARDSNDLESLFLRAEAYLLKKQPGQAKSEFEAILKKDPKSAKALHELGLIFEAQNDTELAAEKFTAALEADPTHFASAVELGQLEIVKRKNVEHGNELLERALSPEGRPTLPPALLGTALALKAESMVVQNKLTDAVPLFEEAIKADPANSFTNGRLAHAYSELNQPEKAAPLYQAASKAQPENLEYTEGYLSSLILLGKMDEATKVMGNATTRFPGNAKLSYLGGRVADVLDNSKEAEESYKRAIAADATIIEAYLYLSRLYMRFRRFGEATPVLEAGVKQAPDNAAMRAGIGELALHERDFDRAEAEFKKAIELNPYSADAHLGASRVAQERGNFEEAAKDVEKALELNPRIAGGRLQRGVCLWKLKRLDEAVTELEAAREAEPKNVQIVVTLGAVKFDKGDLNGALSHLNTALLSDSQHPDANFFLARVKNAKLEHTQAIEAMKRALDYNPKNPLYLYWYGRLLADARKVDDAIVELKLALEVDPRYADALEALGRISFDRNDFKRAVSYYQQALEADPSRHATLALVGDSQMKMEDWTGAIASYTKALETDSTLTQAYAKLGLAYQEKHQLPQATEWFKKAVTAEPENADAWLALGYLAKDTNKKKDAIAAFQKYLQLRPEAEDKKAVGDEIYYLQSNK